MHSGCGRDVEVRPATMSPPMLSERLVAAEYARTPSIFEWTRPTIPPRTIEDRESAHNMSHGWAVPILEHMIESVIVANPQRQISLVGFSMGRR